MTEPTHCMRMQCSDSESSTRIVNPHFSFAYVVVLMHLLPSVPQGTSKYNLKGNIEIA